MVTQYRFEHLFILLGLGGYLVACLWAVRSIIDTSDATVGWKFYWSAIVLSFPLVGLLAWLTVGKSRKKAKNLTSEWLAVIHNLGQKSRSY